jgi:hypothetical protein
VTEQKNLFGVVCTFFYTLVRIIVRRLAKLNVLSFQASPKIMTLIRFVQRASILAGITFAGIAFHGGSATAQSEKFCVVASNGKTACGTLKAVERACVSTDNGVVCGKFKSVAAEQGQESVKIEQGNTSRTVVDGITFSSKGCTRSDTTIKCGFSMRNKSDEKYFSLTYNNAKMTDSSGKTYIASTIEMLGQKGATSIGGKLASEIDYEGTMTFDNVPEGVKKAQLLSFPFAGKTVNLRNLTFSN